MKIKSTESVLMRQGCVSLGIWVATKGVPHSRLTCINKLYRGTTFIFCRSSKATGLKTKPTTVCK